MIKKDIRPFRFKKLVKHMRWRYSTQEYITELYNHYNTKYNITWYKLWFKSGWNIEIEYAEKL